MKTLALADREIKTELPAFVMGIVNCTPDSFYSNSRFFGLSAVSQSLNFVEEGADIIDIGGESTRPGSEYVDEKEELSRVIPVIRSIRKISDIPISVDTRKVAVMKAAWNEGADILNDISALEDSLDLATFAAEKKIPVILCHKRGIPASMQKNTEYEDIFSQVSRYLEERATFAVNEGILPEKIIVDPGIGFAKDFDGNIELISKCGLLCNKKYKVLMALSRKTCIGQITGRAAEKRLAGTLAANLVAVKAGAFMLRVHDVADCVDTLKVLKTFGGLF